MAFDVASDTSLTALYQGVRLNCEVMYKFTTRQHGIDRTWKQAADDLISGVTVD